MFFLFVSLLYLSSLIIYYLYNKLHEHNNNYNHNKTYTKINEITYLIFTTIFLLFIIYQTFFMLNVKHKNLIIWPWILVIFNYLVFIINKLINKDKYSLKASIPI